MGDWQPIETAPKDGTYIRLWNGAEQGDGYWELWERDDQGRAVGFEDEALMIPPDRWMWSGEGFAIEPEPTHWMPLPRAFKTCAEDTHHQGNRCIHCKSGGVPAGPLWGQEHSIRGRRK